MNESAAEGGTADSLMRCSVYHTQVEPLSLITFLLCIAAAVGIALVLLHMLSLWFK